MKHISGSGNPVHVYSSGIAPEDQPEAILVQNATTWIVIGAP